MRVLIGGKRVRLDLSRVLGEGGEATVIAHDAPVGPLAIKLYKGAPSASRASKLGVLSALGRGSDALRARVLLPRALVQDPSTGAVLGFTMDALGPGWEPVAVLAKAQARAAAGVDFAGLVALLVELGDGVEALHRAGVVVGDLNDQNELFAVHAGSAAHDASPHIRFIDADSFQVGSHPCEVSTEAFLDPELYGPDLAAPCLTAGGRARRFTAESDWWSWAVIALRALVGAHPFGGVCADSALTTIPRRARAHKSVLSPDVRLPVEARLRADALPPALRGAFAAVLEGGARGAAPRDALRDAALGARSCGCGLGLLGGVARCPRCTTIAPARERGLTVRELARVDGELVAVSVRGARWLALARDGAAPRADGCGFTLYGGALDTVGATSLRPAWPFASLPEVAALSEGHLLLAARGARGHAELACYDANSGARLAELSCELGLGRPAACLVGRRVLRAVRGALLELDLASGVERHVGAVVAGQARLAAAGEGAIVTTLLFGARRWALQRGAAQIELEGPTFGPGAALLAEAFAGDDAGVAGLFHVRAAGRDAVCRVHWDLRGKKRGESASAADTRALGLSLAGGALRGGALLLAGDAGLAREDLATGAATLFAETEPFVRAETPLALAPRGVLAAVGPSLRLFSLGGS